ncbi:MAG: PKD domain-containing protein, partial [archaeon]
MKNAILLKLLCFIVILLSVGSVVAAAPYADVTPNEPFTTQTLLCEAKSTSLDPDYFLYQWRENGNVRSDLSGYTTSYRTVSSSHTSPGEVWECSIYMPDPFPPYLPIEISDNYKDSVTIRAADKLPQVDARAVPSSGKEPLGVSFQCVVTQPGDTPYTFNWEFGDPADSSSSSQNPSFTYNNDGTYTATCSIRDADGDTHSDSVTITVNPDAPDVELKADPESGLEPLTVDFECDVTGGNGNLIYQWTFGDGNGKIGGADETHTYQSHGSFTATCQVTDENGGGESDSDSVIITVDEDVSPTVDAKASWASNVEPATINFNCELVEPGNGDHTFSWTFGNDNVINGQTTSRVYSNDGSYSAKCKGTDADGDWDEDTVTFTVAANKPIVTLNANKENGETPLAVNFDCQVEGGNPPYLYFWNFGDGTEPSYGGKEESHTYTDVNTYTARCTVTDENGNGESDYDTLRIVVEEQDISPTVDARANPERGREPLKVDFDCHLDEPGNGDHSFYWTFGNGMGTANTQTATRTYDNNGRYTASCKGTDADGDYDWDSVEIIVDPYAPVADLSANKYDGDAPLSVDFTCEASEGNSPYIFELNYGDSSDVVSGNDNPFERAHVYQTPGTYTVDCEVTDESGNGESDTDSVTIEVYEPNTPPVVSYVDTVPDMLKRTESFDILCGGQDDQQAENTLTAEIAYQLPGSSTWNPVSASFNSGRSSWIATVATSTPDSHLGIWNVRCRFTDDDGATSEYGYASSVVENNKPNAVIDSPASGSSFLEDEAIDFSGHGEDVEDGQSMSNYRWKINNGGWVFYGDSSPSITFNDPGTYTVYFDVQDSEDDWDPTPDSIQVIIGQRTFCGDDDIQSPNDYGQYEQCDDGDQNGVVCDPAYDASCDYCSSSCELVTVDGPFCGDDVIQSAYEECDDGDQNGEFCVPGYDETCDYCSDSCEDVTVDGPFCGDGVRQPAYEECDDGNDVDNDGCSSECVIEDLTYCGDDEIQWPNGDGGYEQCDDGDQNGVVCDPAYDASCDYCSSSCEIETVDGPFCGDGVRQPAYEQCDDGNTVSGDGCSSVCVIEDLSYCG